MSFLIFLMLALYIVQLGVGIVRSEFTGGTFWFQALVGLGLLSITGALNAIT